MLELKAFAPIPSAILGKNNVRKLVFTVNKAPST